MDWRMQPAWCPPPPSGLLGEETLASSFLMGALGPVRPTLWASHAGALKALGNYLWRKKEREEFWVMAKWPSRSAKILAWVVL